MKTKEEVLKKIEYIKGKILKERQDKFLCKNHLNCAFNKRHRVKGNGMVGFCTNPDILRDKKFFPCDCEETVKECNLYQNLHTKESIELGLQEIMTDPSLCGKEYPKLLMLLWVIQE